MTPPEIALARLGVVADRGGPVRPSIVVVGLGPAGPELLTASARSVLLAADPLYVRTARHPAAEEFAAAGAISLDHHYEEAATFAGAYAGIVEELVAAAEATGRLVYAVPGSPNVLEATVTALRADERVEVEIVAGLSFLDLAWERLGVDPVTAKVRLVDAERFAVDAAGETGPLLVAQTWSAALLSSVKLAFEEPPTAPAILLHHLGLPDEVVREVAFAELDRTLVPDHLTCLYLPELATPVDAELARVRDVVRELRERCPWDAKQTHTSLVRYLLEETYEAIEAIESLGEDPGAEQIAHLEEELGDVLCQVLFHATIAAEEGWFTLSDVAAGLADKLVRRHPHVYGGEDAPSPEEVLAGWEATKQEEKGRSGVMDGIPPALPALAVAAKLERRAAEVGLAIDTIANFREVVANQLGGLISANRNAAAPMLFTVARITAALGLEPEEELRRETEVFRRHFEAAEAAALAEGTTFREGSPDQRRGWLRATDPEGPPGR